MRLVLSMAGLGDMALEREGMRGAWAEPVSGLLLMSPAGFLGLEPFGY